jgi:hypothetical protein
MSVLGSRCSTTPTRDYEKAYLVTRDSNFIAPAVKMIRAEFPAKHIVTVAPAWMGHSNIVGVTKFL